MSLFGWRTPTRTLPGQRPVAPRRDNRQRPDGAPRRDNGRRLADDRRRSAGGPGPRGRRPEGGLRTGRPATSGRPAARAVVAIGLVALLSGCAATVAHSASAGAARFDTDLAGAVGGSSAVAGSAASSARSASEASGSVLGATDSARGLVDRLGGPAVAGSPGGLPSPAGLLANLAGSAAAVPPPTLWPAVPAALAAPPAVPDVPRQATDLAAQPAPASAPVRVQVESLGIDMPIDPVGLADTGAMALPENPAVAAWYRYGPGPGSPAGATVVAAHVDSLVYDLGPFARLADAPGGTEIVLYTGDGAAHRFAIASIDSVEKQAVPWAGVFDRTGQPRLTLVTCGGEFDYEARRYLSNVIVTAVPVP